MTSKSNVIKSISEIDNALTEMIKKTEGNTKIFVVQSAEQERDIRNEFKDKDNIDAVLIKCY